MQFSRVTIVLSACAYYFVVLTSYARVESVLYREICLNYIELPVALQALIAAMAIAPALWLPRQIGRPSHLALWVLYLTVIVPTMLLPFHISTLPPYEIVFFCGFLLGLFALLSVFGEVPVWEFNFPRMQQRPLLVVLMVTAFALMYLTAQTSGFQFNLSLENIYDRRLNARESVQGGAFSAYAIALLSSSLSPILFGFGALERNAAAFCTGLLGILCTFSLAGAKSELFSLPMILVVMAVLSRGRRSPSIYLILSAAGLVLLSMLQYVILHRNDISVYFIRRLIFVPGLMNSVYWEFFSQNPHIWYRDSFLRSVGDSPYDLPMARLIGETYFHSFENNANGNLWATGFGHGGYLGMFIATLMLGWTLRIIDSLSINCGFRFAAMMTALFSISWSNGSIETSMFSCGVLPSMLIFCFLQTSEAKTTKAVNGERTVHRMPSTPHYSPKSRSGMVRT